MTFIDFELLLAVFGDRLARGEPDLLPQIKAWVAEHKLKNPPLCPDCKITTCNPGSEYCIVSNPDGVHWTKIDPIIHHNGDLCEHMFASNCIYVGACPNPNITDRDCINCSRNKNYTKKETE